MHSAVQIYTGYCSEVKHFSAFLFIFKWLSLQVYIKLPLSPPHLDIKPDVRHFHTYLINHFVILQTISVCYSNSEMFSLVSLMKCSILCLLYNIELLTSSYYCSPCMCFIILNCLILCLLCNPEILTLCICCINIYC